MRDLVDFNLAAANASGCGIAGWPQANTAAASLVSRSLARLAKPLDEIRLATRPVIELAGVTLRRRYLEMAQREALRAMAGAVERLALVWLTWPDAQRLATMTSRELDLIARQGDQVLEFVGLPSREDQAERYFPGLWCPAFSSRNDALEAQRQVRGTERLRAIALAEDLICHGASTPEVGHFTGLNEKAIRELVREIRGRCKPGPIQYPSAESLVGMVKKQEPRLVARATLFATILHQLRELRPGLKVGELFVGALRLAAVEARHWKWCWTDDDVHRCFQAYRLLNSRELRLARCGCGCMQLKLVWHENDQPCLSCRRAAHVDRLKVLGHLGGRKKTVNAHSTSH